MIKTAQTTRPPEQDDAAAARFEGKLTRTARASASAGADVARESVRIAQEASGAAEGFYETVRQASKDSPQFNRDFVELLREQTRQGMEALGAFAGAVNWPVVAQAQSKFFASSVARICQFNARHHEVLLRAMTAAWTSARR